MAEQGDDQRVIAQLRAELEYYRDKAIKLDERVFQMRALLQSGKGFSEILNLDALMQAFMAVCRERYGVRNSAVLLVDDLDADNVFLRTRAYHGLPHTFIGRDGECEEMLLYRIPQDDGLLWQMIKQGEAFSVRDLDGQPRYTTANERWNLEVFQSSVWLPLLRGGRVLGILTLGECEDGSQINEWDYHFLDEIAAVAATNIDSTLKYEKNERILNNLRTLYDVNQQLANVNDFKLLTIETLRTAVEALHAQKANLMLYDTDRKLLEIKVVWGNIPKQTRDAINDGRLSTKSFAIGEGVAGLAAETRKPVRRNDRQNIEQLGRNTVHCIMSVPLLYGGKIMGVMTLTNRTRTDKDGTEVLNPMGRFDAEDQQLLLGLADQAAVNLHKARLYDASITDRLTGLYNARHFEQQIADGVETATYSDEPLCLAIMDIDHFKRFNDTHGHTAGDFVLAETATLFNATRREGGKDACFRYGGEEFCMVLPNTTVAEALELLEAFREDVAKATFNFAGEDLQVTVSVGVACFPDDGTTGPLLFKQADKALFAAKEAGRNRVMHLPAKRCVAAV